jgi:hypothetical protein
VIKSGQRYRIKTPTIALTLDEAVGHEVAITIPEGAIIEITERTDGSRSLHVRCEGKGCRMFTQDLRERGEVVKSAGDPLAF